MGNLKFKKILCVLLSVTSILFGLEGCAKVSSDTLKDNDVMNVNEVNNVDDAAVEITYMDAGKADCILISIDDKSIMIDTGLNSNKEELVSRLKDEGIDTINYLILTHMDKDHIGGADAILDEFKVENVIQADYSKDSKQYKQYIKAIEEKNITPVLLHDTMNINIDNAVINIYPALKDKYSESNNYSIIVDITYGDYSFLFAGDAEEERLSEFMNTNNKNYTVVKIPHHGRINSLSEEFIKSIKPSYSIITCSEEEQPDKEMIELLDKYNVKTFLTKDGDILVKTDGKKISFSQ